MAPAALFFAVAVFLSVGMALASLAVVRGASSGWVDTVWSFLLGAAALAVIAIPVDGWEGEPWRRSTVAVIPLVRMMQDLGLYNTYWALIILYTAFRIPFTTFLIRAYMLGLPRDLDEAAIMDGASEGQIFWKVTLPLCKPILVSCVILHVLFAWNEYLFAMIFTSGADFQTLPVGLTSIMAKHGTNYAVVFAAMTLSALPIVITFFAAQRFFIRGLAEGIGK